MKRSIRVRLLVCVFGLLLPLSAAAGWLFVQLFGNRLMHDIDVALEEEAETVAELAAVPSDPGAVAGLLPHIAGEKDLGTNKYITVSRDGQLLAESPPGAQAVLRSAAPNLRVVRYESDESARPVTVTIAVSAAAATHAQRRLRSLLTVGGPLLVLLFGTGLWLVIGRTLRPLENAARQLGGIGADTLFVRVQTANPDDEVGRMVTVVNRMLDRLERAVAELRRLTADAAHELRTPLTVLRAGLEVALARERPAAEYRAALSDALASTSRLCRLAEDLLTLARLESAAESHDRAPVDLSEMLRELGEAWGDIAMHQHISLEVEVPEGLCVRGNAGDLYRLFNNLIDNAVRHAAGASRIHVSAARVAGAITVSVADNGAGIAPQDMARIFDRFHRGHGAAPHEGGSGLGLNIAQEIARTHGGRITVSNRDGGGCLATVTLPEVQRDA